MIAAAALLLVSCSDRLSTSPTDSGSGDELFKEASTAITAMNGIYRSMFTAGWSTTGNTHQCFGISAYNLALDLMADDVIMQASGNGWFWYDHTYSIKTMNSSSAWRSYDVWYANYTWIANANYVIAAADTMGGNPEDVAFVVGQAYAVRALCYLNLATWFARAPYNPMLDRYRWNDPGVPVYTEGTTTETVGKPRVSLKELYGQIDADIEKAVELLDQGSSSALNTSNKSQISLWTALGIQSRACLAEGNWQGALDASSRVIREGGFSIGTASDLMSGMNSLTAPNVMWGAGIQNTEQTGGFASFFMHMDNKDGEYALSAPKLISKSLYNRIRPGDIRAAWWDPSDKESPYISRKFSFSNAMTWLGDYIYMRVEEMYFTAAEAALRLDDADAARSYMNAVMALRDASYKAESYNGMMLGSLTNAWTGSLLESIITNKRIELWGEFGRLFDVRRLGQGIERTEEDGFAGDCITTMKNRGVDLKNPETYDWVLTIPKAELDANPNINEEDQNP